MKTTIKMGIIALSIASLGFVAQAEECETISSLCSCDRYSIVETEPDIYWPHNEMAAAHWIGYRLNGHTSRRHRIACTRHKAHHHRRAKRRLVSRCKRSR